MSPVFTRFAAISPNRPRFLRSQLISVMGTTRRNQPIEETGPSAMAGLFHALSSGGEPAPSKVYEPSSVRPVTLTLKLSFAFWLRTS